MTKVIFAVVIVAAVLGGGKLAAHPESAAAAAVAVANAKATVPPIAMCVNPAIFIPLFVTSILSVNLRFGKQPARAGRAPLRHAMIQRPSPTRMLRPQPAT